MTAQTDSRRRSRSEPSSTPLDRGELRRKLEKAAPILAGRMGNVPRDEASERIVGFTLHEDIVGLSPGLFMLEAARDVLLAAPSVLDAFDALEAERDGLAAKVQALWDERGQILRDAGSDEIGLISRAQAAEAQVREMRARLADLVLIADTPYPEGNLDATVAYRQAEREAWKAARRALSVTPAAETAGPVWRPISEAKGRPGAYINVRSASTYRWLPYKPDGARQMKKPGRWQVSNGYGWDNAEPPEGSEWMPTPGASPTPPAAEKPQQEKL